MKLRGSLADLQHEFKPGYRLRATGSGKLGVVAPDGSPVRLPDSNLPLTLASTPSDSGHSPKRARSLLIKAGVIEDRAETLYEEMATRPPLEPPAPETEDEARFFDVFGDNRPTMPEAVMNLAWDEYLALERAAGYVLAQGPRAVGQQQVFMEYVNRARLVMERQLQLHKLKHGGNGNGTAAP